MGWLFPTGGDLVAAGAWLLLGAWGWRAVRAERRRERRRRARRPLANRYQQDGWR